MIGQTSESPISIDFYKVVPFIIIEYYYNSMLESVAEPIRDRRNYKIFEFPMIQQ